MSFRLASIAALLTVAGCAVEHGNKAPQPGAGTAPGAPAGAAPGAAMGPMHTVFARLKDTVAIGVYRISLSVVLAPEMDKTAQRAALETVLAAQRKEDSALAAIRVLGFYPPSELQSKHPTRMALVPSVILEWVPKAGGWNGLSAATARAEHATDVVFVSDLPVHQHAPGAWAGR